jgi:hypothetical protein
MSHSLCVVIVSAGGSSEARADRTCSIYIFQADDGGVLATFDMWCFPAFYATNTYNRYRKTKTDDECIATNHRRSLFVKKEKKKKKKEAEHNAHASGSHKQAAQSTPSIRFKYEAFLDRNIVKPPGYILGYKESPLQLECDRNYDSPLFGLDIEEWRLD